MYGMTFCAITHVVLLQVYKTLLAKRNEHDTSGKSFTHVIISLVLLLVDQSSYPFLHTLLHFDTREFLNVLSLVS